MELNSGQTRGMIAVVIGFLITIMMGIALSFVAGGQNSSSQVIMIAVITFIAITPIFGYGVYTYARSTEAEAYETNTDMEKPRLLLDILREQGHGDVFDLAQQLETTPSELRTYVDDLSQLGLFSGIADWENGVIALLSPNEIQTITTCRTCQTSIVIHGTVTICPTCITQYYTY